jgi:hypothetical protein
MRFRLEILTLMEFFEGHCQVWMSPADQGLFSALRGPGESYSDVIIRLAKETTPTKRAER